MSTRTDYDLGLDLDAGVPCQGNLQADAWPCPNEAVYAVVDEHGHRIFVCCQPCRTVNRRVLARLRLQWALGPLKDALGLPVDAVACPADDSPCHPDRIRHEAL